MFEGNVGAPETWVQRRGLCRLAAHPPVGCGMTQFFLQLQEHGGDHDTDRQVSGLSPETSTGSWTCKLTDSRTVQRTCVPKTAATIGACGSSRDQGTETGLWEDGTSFPLPATSFLWQNLARSHLRKSRGDAICRVHVAAAPGTLGAPLCGHRKSWFRSCSGCFVEKDQATEGKTEERRPLLQLLQLGLRRFKGESWWRRLKLWNVFYKIM